MFDHRKVDYRDGLNNPITSFVRMIDLYSGCSRSTDVLKRYMPYQFRVVPGLKLSFYQSRPNNVTLDVWYPGGGEVKNYVLSDKAVQSLRVLWKNPRGGWVGRKTGNVIFFTKRSFVLLLVVPGEPKPFEYEWKRGS